MELKQITAARQASNVELGVVALDDALNAMNDAWARTLGVPVRTLADRLAAEGTDTALRIAHYARRLASSMATSGLFGTVLPPDVYGPPRAQPPAVTAMQEALALSASSDVLLQALAGAIEYYGEQDVSDYASEVLAPALLEVATSLGGEQGGSLLAQIDAARDAVLTLPVARPGEPRYYVVRVGDTLEDVSAVVMGDRVRWPELVATYGLIAPYFSGVSRAGCLSPGHRLLLAPGVGQTPLPGLGMTLGLEVSAGEHGQEEWDLSVTAAGDLAVLVGLPGFAADLALRVATPLGDLPDEPNYGLPELAGLPTTIASVVTALAWTDTLREDPRVEQVLPRAVAARTRISAGVLADQLVVIPRPELLS